MIRVVQRIHAGVPSATLTLPLDMRVKARFKHRLDDGREAGIFLDRGPIMRDGNLLQADDDSIIQVRAAQEEVAVVKTRDSHLFARACYHLGNRHVPLQILKNELRYQIDDVLDAMMKKMGLAPAYALLPFEPEPGAYGEHGSNHAFGRHGHDDITDHEH